MGREVRRVPADWEHPTDKEGRFLPLYDHSFVEVAAKWKADYLAWESGTDPDRAKHPGMEFWEWEGAPPEREYYRPEWPEGSCTHYQMYETVSEGTPVSPVFATPEELARYLAEHGDFWFQKGGRYRIPNAGYDAWLAVCRGADAPSMVVMNGEVLSGVEAVGRLEAEKKANG